MAYRIVVNHSAKRYQVRRAQQGGRTYIIAPVTALLEGVHIGMDAIPTFYPDSEIAASVARWEGTPLAVPGHPVRNGEAISINEVMSEYFAGYFRNVTHSGTALRGEAWFDEARLQSIYPALIPRLEAGDPIEVSSCMMAREDGLSGNWNGEAYQYAVHNYEPDHLAILPTNTGACSLEDGCGVRANKQVSDAKAGAGQEAKPPKMITNQKEVPRVPKMLRLLREFQKVRELQASFTEIESHLNNFVNSLDTAELVNYLDSVYEGFFVYEARRRNSMTGITTESRMYKRSYTVEADTQKVSIVDDAQEVTERVDYIPVANEEPTNKGNHSCIAKETPMSKTELVNALIACSRTPYAEGDRADLMKLSEATLAKLNADSYVALQTPAPAAPVALAAPPALAAPAPAAAKPKLEDLVAAADDQTRSDFKAMEDERNAQRGALTKALVDAKCGFTEEDLKAMSITQLSKLANLAKLRVANFALAAGEDTEVQPGNRANSRPMPSAHPNAKDDKK